MRVLAVLIALLSALDCWAQCANGRCSNARVIRQGSVSAGVFAQPTRSVFVDNGRFARPVRGLNLGVFGPFGGGVGLSTGTTLVPVGQQLAPVGVGQPFTPLQQQSIDERIRLILGQQSATQQPAVPLGQPVPPRTFAPAQRPPVRQISLRSACVGCHTSGSGASFISFAQGVPPEARQAAEQAILIGSMPPGRQLSDGEKQALIAELRR